MIGSCCFSQISYISFLFNNVVLENVFPNLTERCNLHCDCVEHTIGHTTTVLIFFSKFTADGLQDTVFLSLFPSDYIRTSKSFKHLL